MNSEHNLEKWKGTGVPLSNPKDIVVICIDTLNTAEMIDHLCPEFPQENR